MSKTVRKGGTQLTSPALAIVGVGFWAALIAAVLARVIMGRRNSNYRLQATAPQRRGA